jgi:hypothetical protein
MGVGAAVVCADWLALSSMWVAPTLLLQNKRCFNADITFFIEDGDFNTHRNVNISQAAWSCIRRNLLPRFSWQNTNMGTEKNGTDTWAGRTSRGVAIYKTIRYHILKDYSFCNHHCYDVKFHIESNMIAMQRMILWTVSLLHVSHPSSWKQTYFLLDTQTYVSVNFVLYYYSYIFLPVANPRHLFLIVAISHICDTRFPQRLIWI